MATMTLGSRSGLLGEEFGGGGSLLRVTAVAVGVEQAGVCFVQSSTHLAASPGPGSPHTTSTSASAGEMARRHPRAATLRSAAIRVRHEPGTSTTRA